jgi:hypothetical protein
MHEWAALGEEYRHMLDWYYIPQRTAKTTNTGTHVNGYHDGCLRHLIGEGINAKEAKETKQWHSNKTRSIAVAVHHFKPCLRDAVQKSRNHSKMLMKHRCSRDEGRQAGLTQIDLCKVPLNNSPDQVYYLIPNNINFDDIKHEIEEAKVSSQNKLLASTIPSTKKKQKAELPGGFGGKALEAIGIPNQSEQRKRTSPTERNFEMLCRDVVKFPQKYVNRLLELEKELEEANELLKKLSLEKEQHISKLVKENEVMRAEFEEKVRMTGLSRLSILSPNCADSVCYC